MTVRVLGCSGAISAGCRTTAFLLDASILIDAGTGVGDLTVEEMLQIDHICISHSHLDHVLAIALLADTVMRSRSAAGRPPILVHALPETIDALARHVFNDVIWPDFTRLPDAAHPSIAFQPFALGDVLQIAGRSVEILPARHTVSAVGFAVDGRQGCWVYTGDTGPNPALWQRLADLPVRHLVIETAFGDDEIELARISGHLCPATLERELSLLSPSAEVHVTHIKPSERAAVCAAIARLAVSQRITPLEAGDVMRFD